MAAKIRKAEPSDDKAIHDCHMQSIQKVCAKDYRPEQIAGWGGRPYQEKKWTKAAQRGHVYVVEDDGKILGIGFLEIREQGGEKIAEVEALYFLPEIIGQGFGKKILDLMKHEAKKKFVKKIILSATKTAKGFYEAQGFVQTGPEDCTDIGGQPIEGYPMEFIVN